MEFKVGFNSDRKYSTECFLNEEVQERIQRRMLYVTLGESQSGMIDVTTIVGVVTDLSLQADEIRGKVKLLDVPLAKTLGETQLHQIVKDYDLCPYGIGRVDGNHQVSEYKLIAFSLTPKKVKVLSEAG